MHLDDRIIVIGIWVFISQKGFRGKYMKRKYIWGYIVLLGSSGFFLFVLISNELNKSEPDMNGLLQNISLSVLCSIIASILLLVRMNKGTSGSFKRDK